MTSTVIDVPLHRNETVVVPTSQIGYDTTDAFKTGAKQLWAATETDPQVSVHSEVRTGRDEDAAQANGAVPSAGEQRRRPPLRAAAAMAAAAWPRR